MDTNIFVVFIGLLLFHVCHSEDAFELGEFLKNEIISIGWNATWISENQLIYTGEKGDIIKHTFNPTETESSEVVLTGETLIPYKGATLRFSSDNSLVLVKYDVQSIFRHSTTAKYAIYNFGSRTFSDIAEKKQLQICSWSPKDNSLVYVFENDIYYVSDAKSSGTGDKMTEDGESGVIYNGVPDWVYEEEVLGTGSAMWFSPDSQHLVYAKFIDTDVEQFTYLKYGEPGDLDQGLNIQYPNVIDIRYPKVGRKNPTFEVHCVKLSDKTTKPLTFLPTGGKSEDFVLNSITWASNKDVIVYYYINRQQTGMDVKRCDIETGEECAVLFTRPLGLLNGWVNVGSPIYKDDGTTAMFIEPRTEDDDSYPHIVEMETLNGLETQRTAGKKTIIQIYGWDKSTDAVYYEGTAVGKHWQKHVYSAIMDENNKIVETCLTCDLDTPEGKCTYATAAFSKDMSYFSLICQGPGPTRTSVHRLANKNTQIWEENLLIRSQLTRKMKPVVEDFTFTFKDDEDKDYDVRVRLILPPQLKKTEDTKYPMIVDVYAGPDSNSISDAFSSGFRNYITTNAKYIYAYIDGRGSGLNGNKNMYAIYKKLGTVEIQDRIRAVRKLHTDHSWVDPDRTCIWGWSYGGFAAASVLTQDVGEDGTYKPVFACGLSVAPVTNFIYYDSIYTERYMGLPKGDNEIGYTNADLTAKADKFMGKKFFLIHGNADDNVHYQQSMLLARALELKDVEFQTMSYPDENHNLRGVYPHLYHVIDKFFRDTFKTTESVGGAITTKSSLLLTLSVFILGWLYTLT